MAVLQEAPSKIATRGAGLEPMLRKFPVATSCRPS
jgi:hypothetical protein